MKVEGGNITDTTSLFAPVAADLDAVEAHLMEAAAGQHPLLAEALRYVFETRGKRLRPALVLLSGALGEYDLDRLVLLAASLEVVHTASLVHDDTIDDALTRRGFTTVNSVWDKHTAIVTGDFLFAKSAQLASRMDSVRIMHMLSETVMSMCAGEMRQYAHKNDWNISIDEYLERVGAKTASLFAMCCSGAGVATRQPETRIEALHRYGFNVGLAFQIVDDILDFDSDERTLGKPAGNDLAQGTITLPAILFMQKLEPGAPLRLRLQHGEDSELAAELIQESGALAEAREYAFRAVEEAVHALDVFPDGPSVRALVDLARYLPTRSR
jgi:geranylgeranyl pyrophosphate synthase